MVDGEVEDHGAVAVESTAAHAVETHGVADGLVDGAAHGGYVEIVVGVGVAAAYCLGEEAGGVDGVDGEVECDCAVATCNIRNHMCGSAVGGGVGVAVNPVVGTAGGVVVGIGRGAVDGEVEDEYAVLTLCTCEGLILCASGSEVYASPVEGQCYVGADKGVDGGAVGGAHGERQCGDAVATADVGIVVGWCGSIYIGSIAAGRRYVETVQVVGGTAVDGGSDIDAIDVFDSEGEDRGAVAACEDAAGAVGVADGLVDDAACGALVEAMEIISLAAAYLLVEEADCVEIVDGEGYVVGLGAALVVGDSECIGDGAVGGRRCRWAGGSGAGEACCGVVAGGPCVGVGRCASLDGGGESAGGTEADGGRRCGDSADGECGRGLRDGEVLRGGTSVAVLNGDGGCGGRERGIDDCVVV